jgi:arylsulfatase A-like enzyme
MKRPNILLIYTDQQRKDSLGCYNNTYPKTPNLDKLAEEGVKLTNYYVNSPVCTPSRMSFLSGRYCSSLGIGTNGFVFPEDAVCLSSLLKPYGYHTAQIGKLHFDPHSRRNHKNPTQSYDFNTFILSDEPGCYDDAYTKWVSEKDPSQLSLARTSLAPAAVQAGLSPSYTDTPRNTHQPYLYEGDEYFTHSAFVADETCTFLNNTDDKPFFCIAGFYAPHTPVNPPKRFVDLFNIEDAPAPVIAEGELQKDTTKKMEKKEIQKMTAYYHALCAHVDDQIGHILDTLEKTGKKDDTIVVFTTDHGEFLGDYGRIQKGMPAYDCIVNVPFIVRYPEKINAKSTINEITEGVDFTATMLDYAGIQIPEFIQGQSMRPLLSSPSKDKGMHGTWEKKDALIEMFHNYGKGGQAALATDAYLYTLDNRNNKEVLFDLKKDPEQKQNAASDPDYTTVLSDMRFKLAKKLMHAKYDQRERIAEY